MKVKVLNLLSRLFSKFAFFGIFSFTTTAVESARTPCQPCPNRKTSAEGAKSESDCYSIDLKTGVSTIISGTTDKSVSLAPGWYRVTLLSPDGSSGQSASKYGKIGYSNYDSYDCGTYKNKTCGVKSHAQYDTKTANGGAGGKGLQISYVFYISTTSSAVYTYNDGAPSLVVAGKKFAVSKAGTGGDASCSGGSSIFSTSTVSCTTGKSGTNSTNLTSGLNTSMDKAGTAVDGSQTGIKLTKL